MRSHRSSVMFTLAFLIMNGLLTAGCQNFTAQALNAEGVRRMQYGNPCEAEDYFNRARNTNPDDADSCYNLGILAHRRAVESLMESDFRQAEEYYKLCLDRNPGHVDCYRGLASLYRDENRPDEAFRLLTCWSNQSPGSPEPKIELARLNSEFCRLNTAEQNLQQALAIDPYNVRALNALGFIYERQGQYNEAFEVYGQSLAQLPNQMPITQRRYWLASNVLPSRGGSCAETCAPDERLAVAPTNGYYGSNWTSAGNPGYNNSCNTPPSRYPSEACQTGTSQTGTCVPAGCAPRPGVPTDCAPCQHRLVQSDCGCNGGSLYAGDLFRPQLTLPGTPLPGPSGTGNPDYPAQWVLGQNQQSSIY